SESEAESWGDIDDEDDVDIDKSDNKSTDDDENDGNNDDDNDGEDSDDKENDDADNDDEQKDEEEEENVDINVSDSDDDDEKDDEEEDHYELLYRDVNVNLHGDVVMTKAEQSGDQPKDQDKFLDLENVNLADYTLTTLMDTSPQQTSSLAITITPLPPPPPQHVTPPHETLTSALTTHEPQTSALDLPDFALIFKFNKRVFNLEQEVSQLKQNENSA
ncbi:hypothetical protein Tco_0119243, partial [Tanacetum coccineum]